MPQRSHRQRLLRSGRELLACSAHQAVSVQTITAAAGVPKGSFYNHFASKDAFGLAVLENYAEEAIGRVESVLLEETDDGPLARLYRLVDEWIELEREGGYARGCLAGNLAQELAAANPTLRRALDGYFRRLQGALAEILFEAQQAGELAADRDPAELAGFLHSAWQGALLRMKVVGNERPLQQFREWLPTLRASEAAGSR